jgi:hypothetical protein
MLRRTHGVDLMGGVGSGLEDGVLCCVVWLNCLLTYNKKEKRDRYRTLSSCLKMTGRIEERRGESNYKS